MARRYASVPFERCATCGAPSLGAYRCPKCTAASEVQTTDDRVDAVLHLSHPLDATPRSSYHPMLFPFAGPITMLVWGRPHNPVLRALLYTMRAALVLYLVGAVIYIAVAAWIR